MVVRLPNWVGDVALALPAVAAIRAARPEARIVGMAREAHCALARRITALDEVLPAPGGRGPARMAAVWRAARRLRAARPAAAVVLAPSFEAALTVWLGRIPRRIGHPTDGRGWLLTDPVPVRPEAHRADAFAGLTGALDGAGAPAGDAGTELESPEPPLAVELPAPFAPRPRRRRRSPAATPPAPAGPRPGRERRDRSRPAPAGPLVPPALPRPGVGRRDRVHLTAGPLVPPALPRPGVERRDRASLAPAAPLLALTEDDRRYARQAFAAAGWPEDARPLFINPAAAKTPRAWSASRFRALVETLARRDPGRRFLVHDRGPFEAPPGWLAAPGVARAGAATLPQLCALLARCALYVGNDSGPAHLAAALGVPTVTVFGPSAPHRTGPRGRPGGAAAEVTAGFPCSPCRERFFEECPSPPSADGRPPCLEAVAVDRMVEAVERALADAAGTAGRPRG